MASIKDYSNHEILSNEAVKELFHDYLGNGSYTAREKLIENHLRLVLKISHSYKGKGMDLEDIVSYGNIGLMKAVDRYNPDNEDGATFATYASYYIKEEIRTAMEKNMIVYHGSFERMKEKEYFEISFDKPFEGDSERSMYDVYGGVVNTFSMNEEQECISTIFSEMENILTKMEYKVLIDIFINRKTMDEIGEENGMTKQNISLIRISALKKMRKFANELFS